MASRIIHYAIAKQLLNHYNPKDIKRFYLGSILPDASNSSNRETHFNKHIDNKYKTHDLRLFRDKYLNKILNDDLYLAYYLHLLQDIIFRYVVYNECNFNPYEEGYVSKLHNDYHILNRYYIDKYNLEYEFEIPNNIYEEELLKEYSFNIEKFLLDMKNDFKDNINEETKLLTSEISDLYINQAIDLCKKEIAALFNNNDHINEDDYKWERRNASKE